MEGAQCAQEFLSPREPELVERVVECRLQCLFAVGLLAEHLNEVADRLVNVGEVLADGAKYRRVGIFEVFYKHVKVVIVFA